MNRVLIIAYSFPPLGGIPVQRALRFVTHLPAFGFLPTVLTVDRGWDVHHQRDPSLLARVPSCVRVERAGEHRRATRLGRGLLRHVWRLPSRALATVRWLLYATALFPDEKRGFGAPAVARAIEIIREERPVAILAMGFPWTQLLAAAEASRATGVPLVADYRDAWTLSPRLLWTTPRNRAAERRVLACASRLIFVTDTMRRDYEAAYPREVGTKATTITNAFEPDPPVESAVRASRPEDGRLNVVYTGTLNDAIPPGPTDRSPLPVLRALVRRPDVAARVRLRFFGLFGQNNARHARSLGLDGTVEAVGRVPHGESLRAQRSADVLLVMTSSGPHSDQILTGKVFEYIGAGRPMLAVAPPGELSDLILKERLGVVCNPDDDIAIGHALAELADLASRGELDLRYPPRPDLAQRFGAEATVRSLAQVLEEVRR